LRSTAPRARRTSRRAAPLIILGVLALLLFVAATLPATLLTGPLERSGISAAAVGGTVWSGRAQGLYSRGSTIGDLEWSLRPTALLRGALAGHARLSGAGGNIETQFEQSFSGLLKLEAARGDLSLAMLGSLVPGLSRNWSGQVSADLAELVIDGDWPVSARGTVDVRQLAAPPPRAANLGSFRLTLPGPTGNTDELRASVTQTEGPLVVDGQLTVGRDRSFLLEGHVAPRGTPSSDLANLLRVLGPPDAQGRRPFSMSGTF
jgi:general secretion pathway protein N